MIVDPRGGRTLTIQRLYPLVWPFDWLSILVSIFSSQQYIFEISNTGAPCNSYVIYLTSTINDRDMLSDNFNPQKYMNFDHYIHQKYIIIDHCIP